MRPLRTTLVDVEIFELLLPRLFEFTFFLSTVLLSRTTSLTFWKTTKIWKFINSLTTYNWLWYIKNKLCGLCSLVKMEGSAVILVSSWGNGLQIVEKPDLYETWVSWDKYHQQISHLERKNRKISIFNTFWQNIDNKQRIYKTEANVTVLLTKYHTC